MTMAHKISSLTLKQVLNLIPLVVVLLISIVVIVYLNNEIANTGKFPDQVIADKYEGSFSENLGFLTMLTAEIPSHLDLKSDIEITKKRIIEKYLLDLKKKIDSLPTPTTGIPIDPTSNIEKEKNPEQLLRWLHRDSLAKIQIENLNLEVYPSPAHPDERPYLFSSDKNKQLQLGSVVLIPKPLVPDKNANEKIELSTTVKKEVVFSKVIEKDLLKAFYNKDFKDNDIEIWQAYFIPLSGFVRISKITEKEKENLVEYYRDILPSIACFSDRPYFKRNMEKEEEVRPSYPYIDSAGNGIIITYSMLIRNENLKIVGMIAIDRKMKPLEDILKNIKLGSAGMPRGFQFKIHPIVKQECSYCHTGKYGKNFDYKYMRKNFSNEALSLAIAEAMENPNEIFKRDIIKRIDFSGRKSTIYLIRTGTKELACFHFNPDYARRRSQYLALYYVLSFLGIIALMVLALRLFLSRVQAVSIHKEVVSHLNGGLVIVDGPGNIKFHNQKMAELVEQSNLNNKNFTENFLAIETKYEYKDLLQKSRKGFDFAGQIKRADSTVFPAIITSAELNYPGISNAQMLIIIPSEQLERTIASNFIHGFSHTLKTPIQSILLLADRMRRKNLPPPKFDRYFSLMKHQVDEFTIMVTNLLKFSKLEIENTRPSREPHNLAALLRSVVKPFKEKAARANNILIENIPESLQAHLDRDMLRVILNNLMENAMKYTAGGEISVEAYEKGNEIVISVSDTGIGVPGDERERIFDKFFRGSAPEVRLKDGIGIGLYLSKKYAKLHGGDLIYEPNTKKEINEKGKRVVIEKGSKFIIHFPKE